MTNMKNLDTEVSVVVETIHIKLSHTQSYTNSLNTLSETPFKSIC